MTLPTRRRRAGSRRRPRRTALVWIANGIYPGWQAGDRVSLTDPREPAPSPEEVGRGPIPEALGRFNALRFDSGAPVLDYVVSGVGVSESIVASTLDGRPAIIRRFTVAPARTTLRLAVGARNQDLNVGVGVEGGDALTLNPPSSPEGLTVVAVAPHDQPIEFSVMVFGTGPTSPRSPRPAARAGLRK